MYRYLACGVVFLVSGCSSELKDDTARSTLEQYVKADYCKQRLGAATEGCENPKVTSMTSLKTTSPTEREAGAKIEYTTTKVMTACEEDVTAKFNKTEKGWMLSRVEGFAAKRNCMDGAWSSPKSFEMPVVSK